MTQSRARRVARIILYVLIGLVAAWLLCGIGSFTAIHFLKQPPDEVRRVVEPRLDAIRGFAEASAARCPEVRSTGLLAQIEGTVPVSPARGSALEGWPELAQVQVQCMWYGPDGGAAGNSFLPLHDVPRPESSSSEGMWEISEGFFLDEPEPSREESAMWPSFEIEAERSIDVKVRRPLAEGDGYIEVTVTLRR